MPKAIRLHAHGGPEVLQWEVISSPMPGPGEVTVRQHAVGLNFIDVYFRTGLYKVAALPAVIGMEGAGVVEVVGSDVTSVVPGDRVAYCTAMGAYAEIRTIAAAKLVTLPADVDFDVAAAVMLQGMTAQYLLKRTRPVVAGETILVHAAAGGLGLLLCQWGKHLGANVIGVVSTEAKANLARANGAAHVVVGTGNLPAEVKRITGGAMLPVVYDGTGQATFTASLDCLAPRGLMVSYGNASGEVKGLDLSILTAKGSLYVTRPTLATYTATRDELLATADDLFDAIRVGAVTPTIGQRFPLADAASAHRALEARATTGSTVLVP